MNDVTFEPFGEILPPATPKNGDVGASSADKPSNVLYMVAIASFWLIVAVIVVARISFHGNIFAFGG